MVRLEPGRSANGPDVEPTATHTEAAATATSPRTTTLPASSRDVAAWALTDAGREELADWWTSPVARRAPERDELVIKLALATASPGVDVVALIQRQRQATQTVLHEINRARRAAADEDLAATLVLDHHVFVVEAELRWLDDVEGRLARAAADGRRS